MNEVDEKLLTSALDGDIKGVKDALKDGADVNIQDSNNETPLFLAAAENHVEVIRLLLKKGADIDIPNINGGTPLIIASIFGNTDAVKVLLKNGADFNYRDNEDFDSLMHASGRGHAAIVSLLLKYGAKVNGLSGKNSTALMWASFDGHPDVVRVLLQYGADVNMRSGDGETALTYASQQGDLEVVRMLLQHGAEVNARNLYSENKGMSPLMRASSNNHVEIVELLLQNGADTDFQDNNGRTALIHASEDGYFDVVNLLLRYGADTDLKDKNGRTALMHASEEGHFEIVELLEVKNTHSQSTIRNFPLGVFDSVLYEDTSIANALDILDNFIIIQHGSGSVINRRDFKAYNTVFYACRRSNGLYGDNNVYYNKKYIKLYPNNVVVEIPSWWNDETIPGSRIFKLEKAYKVPALLSQSVLDDQDMTSGDHCQGAPVQVYQLHMVSLPLLRRYAFQQVLKSFNLSQLRRVYYKIYGKKCPVKTKRSILKILQRK